jgi:hypothetical protein
MGQKHRIDVIDTGVDQLFAQVGRSIDQNARRALTRAALGEQ